MHRIDHIYAAPGGFFTEGVPNITPATVVTDDWMNDVQEELAQTVEGAGITLVKGTQTQLLSALQAILRPAPPGRLTLTSGTAVTTADVSGATTVYYTPHHGSRISLYNGTRWVSYALAEVSQATTDATKSPAAVANNSNYDVFVWDDGGTVRATRGPAWSSDTARGTGAGTTELEFFEGRWVNKVAVTNGPAARRGLYAGTIRSDGSAAINDTFAKRHVWNMYNRVLRPMRVQEATNQWTYTVLTWRQANASTANQLDFVIGLAEDSASAEVEVSFGNSDAGGTNAVVGIGLDSTSALASGCLNWHAMSLNGAVNTTGASWKGYPGIGRHALTWLEASVAVGTTTWYSDVSSPEFFQSGISGEVVG